MRGSFIGLAALVGAAAAFVACGGEEPTTSQAPANPPARPAAAAPAPPAETAATTAQAIFSTRCFTCHGEQGAGDGPGSVALDPKPRDFRDPAWQDSVTDDHLSKVILYGGSAVGRSPVMPGNPDLMSKPAVTAALIEILRSLRAS